MTEVKSKYNSKNEMIFIELNANDNSLNNVFSQLFWQIDHCFDLDPNKNKSIEDIFNSIINNSKFEMLNIKIVIIISDFEKFNMIILNKLILITKFFVDKLSIGFIFIKNHILNSNLNNHLPMGTIDYLIIKIIKSDFQQENINAIISIFQDIIMDEDIRFKFHPKLIKKLIEHFDQIEFSVHYLKTTLRIHVFYYFYQNPLSIVCQENDEFKLSVLNDKENYYLNCFKNSLNIVAKFSNDNEYVEHLADTYHSILMKNSLFTIDLKILLKLFHYLNISTQNFIFLYTKGSIGEYNFQENILYQLYNDVTQNKMFVALNKLLKDFINFENISLIKTIKEYSIKLNEIIQKDYLETTKQNESAKQLGLECQVEIVKNKFRKINSRYEWQQSLKPCENRNQSQYSQWKKEFIREFDHILSSDSLFSEQIIIDALFCNIEQITIPSSRRILNQALNKTFASEFIPSYNILFNLYKEQSNHLNLDKWYELFHEEKTLIKKTKTVSEKERIMTNCLFLNTIFDFEYIGLLKRSTKNKFTISAFI